MSEQFYSFAKPIAFTFPLSLKDLKISYWLSGISVDTYAKRYSLQYPKEYLYIALNRQYSDIISLSEADRKLLSYTISNYNLYAVQEIFETGLLWFSQENRELLYTENSEGVLIFNGEYNNLSAKCVDEYSNVRTALKICPGIVEVANNVYEPGVILYINRTSNSVILKESDFKKLARFIIQFRFETYTLFALQCFEYAERTGSILNEADVQNRLNFQRSYNTNMSY